ARGPALSAERAPASLEAALRAGAPRPRGTRWLLAGGRSAASGGRPLPADLRLLRHRRALRGRDAGGSAQPRRRAAPAPVPQEGTREAICQRRAPARSRARATMRDDVAREDEVARPQR